MVDKSKGNAKPTTQSESLSLGMEKASILRALADLKATCSLVQRMVALSPELDSQLSTALLILSRLANGYLKQYMSVLHSDTTRT